MHIDQASPGLTAPQPAGRNPSASAHGLYRPALLIDAQRWWQNLVALLSLRSQQRAPVACCQLLSKHTDGSQAGAVIPLQFKDPSQQTQNGVTETLFVRYYLFVKIQGEVPG
jgi:hypothetical protein